jgi:hypothetical protein
MPIGTTSTFAVGRLVNADQVRDILAAAADGDSIDLEVRVDAGTTVQMLLGDHLTEVAAAPADPASQ